MDVCKEKKHSSISISLQRPWKVSFTVPRVFRLLIKEESVKLIFFFVAEFHIILPGFFIHKNEACIKT